MEVLWVLMLLLLDGSVGSKLRFPRLHGKHSMNLLT